MTGVDISDDLATLLDAIYQRARLTEAVAAHKRVEAELSRLREELDAAQRDFKWQTERLIGWKMRHDAAEARCARLQQALDGIESTLGTMSLNGLTGDQQKAIAESWGMAREKRPDPELVYATDGEALAGPGSEQSSLTEAGSAGLPDTPADSQECDHGITLADKQTGIERCVECGSKLPADEDTDGETWGLMQGAEEPT